MKKTNLIITAIIMCVGILSVTADAEGIKARLAKRLPLINKLKAEGALGENCKAYLEARKEVSADVKKLIAEENADRKKIYAMLAKKTGQTVEIVAARRALAIAEKTKKGYWLQKKDGTWYRK